MVFCRSEMFVSLNERFQYLATVLGGAGLGYDCSDCPVYGSVLWFLGMWLLQSTTYYLFRHKRNLNVARFPFLSFFFLQQQRNNTLIKIV